MHITDVLMGLLGKDLKNVIIQIMHILQIKKKPPATRTVPIALLKKISDKYKYNLPIGTVMCYNHIKEEQSKTTREQSRDPDYEPQKVIISSPVLNTSVEFSKGLVNCFG